MAESTREQSIREAAFAVFMSAFALMIGLNYISEWIDAAILTYAVLLGLCVVTVVLSAIWWWRTSGTTAVFRMLVLLSSGIGVDAAVQSWSRHLWLSGQNDRFDLFRHTWIWDYRQVVKIVALMYLLAVIISRMSDRKGHYVP